MKPKHLCHYFSAFRCYWQSARRVVPVRGSHCYLNGMYPDRETAKAAADAECARLAAQYPNRTYFVRET